MGILDLLFPRVCFGCGKPGIYICSNCLAKVTIVKPFCPVCYRPSIDGMTHVKCKTPLGLDGLISLFRYEGVIRKAILTLKYKFAYDIVKELSDLCVDRLSTNYHVPPATVLVPIPLHKSRERWRGFNQSQKVGELVAKDLGWEFLADLLIRKVATKSQTELKKEDRRENVKGVFVFSSNQSVPRSLVLFDDVWTTGSTIKEACKVLKRNGAKNVWGLTIAS